MDARISGGKRLYTDPVSSQETDDGDWCNPSARKSPRMNDESDHVALPALPDELTSKILSYLDVATLVRSREVNKGFSSLATQSSSGWLNHCKLLWQNKVHVCREVKEDIDPMTAYKLSLKDARSRNYIRMEELLFNRETNTGTVWSFRFKEAAGADWTSQDPWYNGEPCRKMILLEGGKVKEYKETDGEKSISDPNFGQRTGELMDLPFDVSWRLLSQPLGFPSRPMGSYIRFSVGGRDVPTYCVHRSPTDNWGFIMESCWGVYASFELPPHPGTPLREGEVSDESNAEGGSETQEDRELLIDDESFEINSTLQWREAFLYNFGSAVLPEGEEALEVFDSTYSFRHSQIFGD